MLVSKQVRCRCLLMQNCCISGTSSRRWEHSLPCTALSQTALRVRCVNRHKMQQASVRRRRWQVTSLNRTKVFVLQTITQAIVRHILHPCNSKPSGLKLAPRSSTRVMGWGPTIAMTFPSAKSPFINQCIAHRACHTKIGGGAGVVGIHLTILFALIGVVI